MLSLLLKSYIYTNPTLLLMNQHASVVTPMVLNTGDEKMCEQSLPNQGIAAKAIEWRRGAAGQCRNRNRATRGAARVVRGPLDTAQCCLKADRRGGTSVSNTRCYIASGLVSHLALQPSYPTQTCICLTLHLHQSQFQPMCNGLGS